MSVEVFELEINEKGNGTAQILLHRNNKPSGEFQSVDQPILL